MIQREGFPEGLSGEESACQEMQETWVRSLSRENPLKEELAAHSSILAWRISWTEEPGRLQSMELQSQTQLSDKATVLIQKTLVFISVFHGKMAVCGVGVM